MTPPYELLRVQRDGVPRVLQRGDDLEALLTRQDELREEAVHRGRHRDVIYCVADGDDGERGYAEWCNECPPHAPRGAFGYECDRCASEIEAAHA